MSPCPASLDAHSHLAVLGSGGFSGVGKAVPSHWHIQYFTFIFQGTRVPGSPRFCLPGSLIPQRGLSVLSYVACKSFGLGRPCQWL